MACVPPVEETVEDVLVLEVTVELEEALVEEVDDDARVELVDDDARVELVELVTAALVEPAKHWEYPVS